MKFAARPSMSLIATIGVYVFLFAFPWQPASGMSTGTRQSATSGCDGSSDAAAAAAAAAAPAVKNTRVFSSGYNNEIWEFHFDPKTGHISETEKMRADPNLSFMEFGSDGSLYAIHEVQSFEGFNDGAVSRWKLTDKGLESLQKKRSLGWGPAHVLVDEKNGFVYVSNYGGGSFTAFRLNADGSMGGAILNDLYGRGSGADAKGRQAASHAHGAAVYDKHVYVVDLGSDKIFHYEVRNPRDIIVKATPYFTATPPGAGPRHMTIDSEKGVAYVVFELKNLVQSYRIDAATGALTHLSDSTLLPETLYNSGNTDDYGAELALHPNGRFLFVSNRGHGAICVFAVDGQGGMNRIQMQELAGTWPRHFLVHPEGRHLLVAEQFKNQIEVLHVDPDIGRVSKGMTIGTEPAPTVLALL